jgi:hypothetical protein
MLGSEEEEDPHRKNKSTKYRLRDDKKAAHLHAKTYLQTYTPLSSNSSTLFKGVKPFNF